jgi:hypothetical protein
MTTEELQADAKLVYNGTLNDLVALAAKYNVTTIRSKMIASGDIDATNYAGIGIAHFPSKSDQKEIRSKLYATIKAQIPT